MKKITLLIQCVFLILVGCQDEDVKPEEITFDRDGFYDLVSLTADQLVDLDRDGSFSSDILVETRTITEPTFFKNIEQYFVELKTEVYDWTPRFYHQQIVAWLPYTGVVEDSNGNYLHTEYAYTNVIATYKYSKVKNLITITSNYGNGAAVVSAELIDDVLTLKIRQYYYTTDWEELNITGVYKKRE